MVPERNRTCEVSERHHREVETEESLPPPTEACHPIPTLVTEARRTFSNMSLHTGLNLPTITISNSSAMFSVSSTSSQNLCPSVPLAIRRGNKLPAPLFLSQAGHNPPGHENELGLYPGIPTPFRGSPSMSTPVFQLAHDSYVSTMDVRSMCEDLRSRCPPLRPDTPTNIITNASEIISDVISDTSDESEEDEWAFAASLLTKSSETPDKSRDAIAESTADSDILPPEPCPNELGDLDTSRPSWANAEGLADARDEGRSALPDRTAGLTPKQQRRKTVIIETPDSSLRRRNRMTLDLSHLTDDHHDGDDDNNETRGQYAIPFETPSSAANFSPDGFSSSTPSRPASSATMRPPVKGILKGRKSVRFSVLPSMHEYPLEEPHLVEQPASPSPKVSLSLPSKSQGSGPYSSKVKLGSPLRQTFVAKSPSPKVSPRGYRSTFPKHPAVRAIIKDSSSNSSTASSSSPPSSPTTARRLPLRIKNDRQSLPTRLSTPSPLGPSKARKTIGLEDIGSPRRLKTAISRKPSSNRVSSAENENSVRRDSATSVLQKTCSRSSLRSIFTKLRA